MKKIILSLSLLFAINVTAQREIIHQNINLERLPCIKLDERKMYGIWDYETINGEAVELGIFKTIMIDRFITAFVNYPALNFRWQHLGCSIIQGFNESENLRVSFIDNNTMRLIGIVSGTIWILKRQ